MPTSNPAPQLFEIEIIPSETGDPQGESYVIRIHLEGTYDVRAFLSDNGVDEKRVALAIAELGRSRHVSVWNLQEYHAV